MLGHIDFNNVRKSWDKFWCNENERPTLSIILPKEGVEAMQQPAYLEAFNGDYARVAQKVAKYVETHTFLGEAIPFHYLELGADHFAALLGADLELSASGDTSWAIHTLHELTNADIKFDKSGVWWQKTVEYYKVLRNVLGDEVMIAAPSLSSGLDALVALRGATNVLYDLLDNPNDVHDILSQINIAYAQILNACAELFEYKKYGSINRHGMYSTGLMGIHQCDFSCMLSPFMFEEFVVPILEYEMSLHDAVEYHLDGPGALQHLNRLSQIKKLDIIQWVPGAGDPEKMDWTHLYSKIVSLGKGLILGVRADDLITKCELFPTKKVFYKIYGIDTQAQAQKLIEQVERFYDKNRS